MIREWGYVILVASMCPGELCRVGLDRMEHEKIHHTKELQYYHPNISQRMVLKIFSVRNVNDFLHEKKMFSCTTKFEKWEY